MAQSNDMKMMGGAVLGCGGLVGMCFISGVAMSSGWVGSLMAVVLGAAAIAIVLGKVGLSRKYALIPGLLCLVSLFGTTVGISQRAASANAAEALRVRMIANAEAEVVRARVESERLDAARAAAPQTIERAATIIAEARAHLEAGRFQEASTTAQGAVNSLAALEAMSPQPEGTSDSLAAARSVIADVNSLTSIAATLAQAEAAIASEPGDDVIAWSLNLRNLATTLQQAPPVAVSRYGQEITQAVTNLDRRRGRFRRQLQRAEREAAQQAARAEREANERAVLDLLCGERPTLSPWDGELVGSERAFGQRAHDPDSVDVENCTPPVLTRSHCWVTTCNVRANNAFGMPVLQRVEFTSQRQGISGFRVVRR